MADTNSSKIKEVLSELRAERTILDEAISGLEKVIAKTNEHYGTSSPQTSQGPSLVDLSVEELRSLAGAVLGRLGGKRGGPARAEKLTPERRKEIARKAAETRWAKARNI